MADNKTLAAAFALGLAGGGAGGDQLAQQEIDAANARAEEIQAIVQSVDVNNPTIKSYVRSAAEQGITDVLEKKLVSDRGDQMTKLAREIEKQVDPGEAVPLTQLTLRLAEKTPENWLPWYADNFSSRLDAQIATGIAVGNLSPDQLVRVQDVVNVMIATAAVYIAPIPAGIEFDMEHAAEVMAEDEARKARRIEEGTWLPE